MTDMVYFQRKEAIMGEMNLIIKDEHMLERITDLARAHNRSPDVEALALLSAGLEASEPFDLVKEARRIAAMTPKAVPLTDSLSRRERADAISAMTPKGVLQTDSTLLIREERDRNH